jgi:toxin ParE1/3/4
MPQVRRSLESEKDLIGIWLHIAEDDPIAADAVLDFLEEQFRLIAEMPKIGRNRDDLWPGGYCFNAGKNSWRSQFLVFYALVDDGIEIARVFEGHRNIEPGWFE